MKCTIPEISWHNRDPVLSIDIQPNSNENIIDNVLTRLASAGSDSHVLIWYILQKENGSVQLDLAADLARHQRAVNAVRWSPSGEFLASGDDESIIFIWKLKSENEPINVLDDNNEQDKETWQIYKTLRGHLDDVYDLSWSSNSLNLISGSVDNTAIVWDIKKGKHKAILTDHKGFVQGVAWDPKNQYLATLATDRYFRVFDVNTNKVVRRLNKSTYPVADTSPLFNKTIRLFHDDTMQTFYRRLCFSPDGELIIVPSGLTDLVMPPGLTSNNTDKPISTTYIFTRYCTKQPAIVIPSPDQYTVAVRCCPLLFELRPYTEDKPPAISLPYRMIFAIATKSSVYLYDTQQTLPFGSISNIHYARLTDMTWSSNGNILIVSSVDGFCTLITFEDGELGTIYKRQENDDEELEEEMGGGMDVNKETEDENEKPHDLNKMSSVIPTRIEIRKTPRVLASANENAKTEIVPEVNNQKIVTNIDIPETIIATTETFESPEYKEKQATPIAIRREPRTNPSTPVSIKKESPPKSQKKVRTASGGSQKVTPIAVRRQPRNILATPQMVDKSANHQDEALDAWPIPIDRTKNYERDNDISKMMQKTESNANVIDNDKTEDMRLIYEGDSEIMVIKTSTTNTDINMEDDVGVNKLKTNEINDIDNDNKQYKINENDSTVTPDSKNPKTPRRVQLRTISTPKSKKKLL